MKNARVSGVFEVSAAPDNGVSSFKQTVFIRQDSSPSTPTGGSYADPYPDEEGWEDGIPAGNEVLWASTRVFSSDGNPPQQAMWSTPRQMADTSNFIVRYSSVESPMGNPDTRPSEWYPIGDTLTIWMATKAKENGEWGDWTITRVVGEDGESAEYDMAEADVATISRTKTGYSPYSFYVKGYHVKGATRTINTSVVFNVYGVKGGAYRRLVVGASTNYNFNASTYYTADYDAFLFELCKTDDTLLASTTVSVSRDGKDGADGKQGNKGYTGARMRMRTWSKDDDYLQGKDDEEWYDVVEYEYPETGETLLYLCVRSHGATEITPQEDVANNLGNWEVAQEWAFVATKLLLAERIKSDMIDTDDLVAKRIYTDPVGVVKDEDGNPVKDEEGNEVTDYAHIEMVGSEMKVFNQLGLMNIRFGVNEDGYAVLEYYDNDGRKLYDLGPEGITKIPVSEASWTELWYEKLGDSISEVLEARDYKRKTYNFANKVYRYHSKIVAGVVDDEENNGRLFASKALNDTYVLEDGIYRIAPSSSAGNNVFMSINPDVVEQAILVGLTELTSEQLPGMDSANELVLVMNPVYAEQLYRCEGGFMASSGITAYWNGKPVVSEA